MASVVISGDTSGTATLQAQAIAGNTTLTLPTTSGTVALQSGDLGTPSAIVLTNATGTANALNAGIGVNQTWQNVTASRAWSTDYTNTTGKPIMFSVTHYAGDSGMELLVGGVLVGQQGQTSGSGDDIFNMMAIVPNGTTYRANPLRVSGSFTWVELR
jgi:hypothetical protein